MKVRVTIIGKVHNVGYRLFLLNQASSLLIDRFHARNIMINGKQALVVLVEGSEDQVREFLKFVRSQKPEKADVEEIRVEEYDGAIETIESYRSSLMMEQLSKIVQVGLNMLEKQDKMLEKQDETIKEIRETRNYLGKKIDGVGEKIEALRTDLKTDESLKKIEKEIEAIKARIGMS